MATLKLDRSDLHYEQHGDGPPVVFVHGGVLNGTMTWSAQEPLAERWRLVIIDRPGFGTSSPVDRVDFATDAEHVVEILDRATELWGVDRVHLVGHSYGGVISLLAAAARPAAVASLSVIEPPAFALAAGDTAVDDLVAGLKDHWRHGPHESPSQFLDAFLRLVGSATELPDPLPPPLAQGAAMLIVERGPWEANIPLEQLAAAAFPKLVISGAHSAAFDAVCDVLERDLDANRAVIPGAGHSVPRIGEAFNQELEQFLTDAQRWPMTTPASPGEAFDAFEAAGWEKAATAYDRFFGPITARVAEPLLDAAHVGPETRVLDVATGPGYVAGRAAERGAAVTGVDISEQMVTLARTTHPAIDIQQGDAGRLAFGGDSFDAVVGNFALPHLASPELAVAGFARVLGERGMLALSMWDAPERARVLGLIVDAVEQSGATPPADLPAGPPFFRFSSDAELSRLLHGAEFDDVEVRTLSFTHRLSGADELWQGVLAGTVRTAPLVLGQSGETQREIRATFDRLAGEYAVAGGLEVPVSVKVASGRKRQGKAGRR